jgi:lysine-N-methylase
VNVDRATYETYQRCEDPLLGPRLREVVTIQPAAASDERYARIGFSGTTCPFLTGGLCGIQNTLGESYLSTVCARFPRTVNTVDDVFQRSLDLSCPEAARLLLLDPNPMAFDEEAGPPGDSRIGEPSMLTTLDDASPKPYRYFQEIRAFAIDVLQYRAYPLWQRLVVLASFCDRLEQLAAAGRNRQVPGTIQWFREAMLSNSLNAGQQPELNPVVQLAVVLELIVARITGEYVSPRFLECYREFKEGIEWTAESSMEEIGARYAAAYRRDLEPFVAQHGHMLEHYLVSYVHNTLFPLGAQKTNRDPSLHPGPQTVREHCLTMFVHYGVIQTVLTGVAAFRRPDFGTADVIRVIQSVTKVFEHNLAFPQEALKILEQKGARNCVSLALLLRI